MADATGWPGDDDGQDRRIEQAFARERGRLWRYIRSRMREQTDAEDVLQDVFYELVVAYRLMRPIEHLSGWLFQVARNRIADLRRRRATREGPGADSTRDPDLASIQALMPAPGAGPEAEYARGVLLDELEDALAALPVSQREVFIAHELEGRSMQDIAAETGVELNTVLSRKRYAVLRLRRRLESIHEEFHTGAD